MDEKICMKIRKEHLLSSCTFFVSYLALKPQDLHIDCRVSFVMRIKINNKKTKKQKRIWYSTRVFVDMASFLFISFVFFLVFFSGEAKHKLICLF